jgi:hypothetical protein
MPEHNNHHSFPAVASPKMRPVNSRRSDAFIFPLVVQSLEEVQPISLSLSGPKALSVYKNIMN